LSKSIRIGLNIHLNNSTPKKTIQKYRNRKNYFLIVPYFYFLSASEDYPHRSQTDPKAIPNRSQTNPSNPNPSRV